MDTRTERETIIRDWLAIAEGPMPEVWTLSEATLTRLIETKPQVAWDIVTALIDRVSTREGLEFLAASPLESLLSYHGPMLIDAAEVRARDNTKFREALTCLRRLGMTDDVWARIQSAAAGA